MFQLDVVGGQAPLLLEVVGLHRVEVSWLLRALAFTCLVSGSCGSRWTFHHWRLLRLHLLNFKL